MGGQPKDPRGYPPRFFELLERVGAGETISFKFPQDETGRKRCYSLCMKISAFRSLIRKKTEADTSPKLIAAAWEMEIIRRGPNGDPSLYEFTVRPQQSFAAELDAALDGRKIT